MRFIVIFFTVILTIAGQAYSQPSGAAFSGSIANDQLLTQNARQKRCAWLLANIAHLGQIIDEQLGDIEDEVNRRNSLQASLDAKRAEYLALIRQLESWQQGQQSNPLPAYIASQLQNLQNAITSLEGLIAASQDLINSMFSLVQRWSDEKAILESQVPSVCDGISQS